MAKKGKKVKNQMWADVRDAILPSERIVAVDARFEPAAVAPSMSAERMHGILRSAESGQTQELFALYRDVLLGSTHILAEFSKRKLAVLKLPINFSPRDRKNPDDVRAAELVKIAWDGLKGKMDALTHLLDSSLYPVSIVEKTYRPSKVPGLRFEWGSDCGDRGLEPVAYHLLDFTMGHLRLQHVDEHTKMPRGDYFVPSPLSFVIHRGHLLTSIPDNWGGPMRAGLFWWLFSVMDRGWWVRFLERFGFPFPVAKYDDGRDDTKAMLQSAFSAASRIFGLVVTKGTDIELLQANATQSGDAFEQFKSTADKELSKLILGQTMTTEAQGSGLNSSQAQVHNDVRNDFEGFDATKLAETLQDQVIDPFVALNSLPGNCRVVVGQEDPGTAADTLKTLEVLPKCGLEIADDGLEIISRRLGLPIVRSAVKADKAPPANPFSEEDDPREIILAGHTKSLAEAFGASTANLRPGSSRSAADYGRDLRATLSKTAPHRTVRALEAALASFAAAGA